MTRRSGPAPLWAGILGVLVALGGCKEEERKAEAPRPVRTILAKPAAIGEEVVQTGEIQPHIETDLGFRIDGRVASRTVEVGALVEKGQLLATLNPEDVQNEVRAVEADLKSAEAAEALAKSTLDRQRMLFEREIVALARVEEVEANWRSASARRRAVQANLETVRNKLNYTALRAPDDGIVGAVGVNPGQVVNAGQMAVKLASTREKDAVFNVSERLMNALPADARVEVALTSNPAVRIAGPVRDVSPIADATTRSYRVRIALPGAPPAMAFGATVTGRLVVSGAPLIALPASAVTSEGERPAVFVVDPARQELVRKPVVVARYSAAQVLVASGIAEGDAVVTAGISKLRPGQKVASGTGGEASAR
ncbi:efflux RND transporter periplasmic adaptor subunit [Methylobacterium sp. ID0610]|uniref:efflux RND transporter periplasmic adaptor subunit n=1 Tax=Methylobacterium carpenticola TaxID=3344827 RepID=UPI0036C2BAD9